jgi:uncharacterized protein YprB with RNaseH-like and TPR domain
MQIDAQLFLKDSEKANSICFFDLECAGLSADYHALLVGSVKPFTGRAVTFSASKIGDDKELSLLIKEELEKYHCWVSYNGKNFDVPFLKTRLLINELGNLEPRHHIDLYQHLKYHVRTSRKSQAHLLGTFNLKEEKLSVSPAIWAAAAANPYKNIPILRKRCESDVVGLQALYNFTKHIIINITR